MNTFIHYFGEFLVCLAALIGILGEPINKEKKGLLERITPFGYAAILLAIVGLFVSIYKTQESLTDAKNSKMQLTQLIDENKGLKTQLESSNRKIDTSNIKLNLVNAHGDSIMKNTLTILTKQNKTLISQNAAVILANQNLAISLQTLDAAKKSQEAVEDIDNLGKATGTRVIPYKIKEEMIGYLKQAKGEIFVTSVENPEALSFAYSINDIFKNAGWIAHPIVHSIMKSPPVKGMEVDISNAYVDGASTPDNISIAIKALNLIPYEKYLFNDKAKTNTGLYIEIGNQSHP